MYGFSSSSSLNYGSVGFRWLNRQPTRSQLNPRKECNMGSCSIMLPQASNCKLVNKSGIMLTNATRIYGKKRGARTSFSSSSPSPVLVPLPSPAMSPPLGAVARSFSFSGVLGPGFRLYMSVIGHHAVQQNSASLG